MSGDPGGTRFRRRVSWELSRYRQADPFQVEAQSRSWTSAQPNGTEPLLVRVNPALANAEALGHLGGSGEAARLSRDVPVEQLHDPLSYQLRQVPQLLTLENAV